MLQASSLRTSTWYYKNVHETKHELTNTAQPSVLATPDLVLKAVYSRSLKSAHDVTSALEQKPAFYSDDTEHGYDDLLADEEIQAVIIA